MRKYHKIQSVYKRNPEDKYKTFLEGQWTRDAFEYLKDAQWEFTEKVDGTNTRFHVDTETGAVTCGGRTDNAQLHVDLVAVLMKHAWAAESLGFTGLTFFGEGYGAGIQKGGHYSPTKQFTLFDVQTDDGMWLTRADVIDIGDKLGTTVVPIVETATLTEMVNRVKQGSRFTSAYGGSTQVEGYVARPVVELSSRGGGRVITKIKYADWER